MAINDGRSTKPRVVGSGEPVRVVVLCHANVARSAAAMCMLSEATDERGIKLALRSAGTHATEGQPASRRTVTAFERVTGQPAGLGGHRAHQLEQVDVEWADLIVAMEDSQVRYVRRTYPAASDRTATLAVLASELPAVPRGLRDRIAALGLAERVGTDAGDVEDPAGGDDDAYELAIRVLADRCGELERRLRG